ncbi:predicted protein [Uncinocarpus reesii 1704]|uniref:Uncharacterized protein n=1 Tax=Uncinocarpus reesii (strain UAMH 1704) TaxID=336963 RepID=C4JHJ3_UNCRE|nr:uncharacterized protein UREG_01356 [Uncinocarpus reesii 1704]EEP76507.1 predicted protein [Uncinocarpus reesii 1704]
MARALLGPGANLIHDVEASEIIEIVSSYFGFILAFLPKFIFLGRPSCGLELPPYAIEPARLALGAAGLAGLFKNVVDCFEYIQIGRNFGTAFQTSILNLDVARLRLTRWGEFVGLARWDGLQSLKETKLSTECIAKAELLLGQIEDLFVEGEGISERYKRRCSSEQSLAAYDPKTDLDKTRTLLHKKMREFELKRQSSANLREKAKWALYEEKRFSRLIEDITALTNGLIDLFPAAEQIQRQPCLAEVTKLDFQNDSLPLLQEAAADQDNLLSDAISEVRNSQPTGSYNISLSGNQNHGLLFGYNTGTINWR